MPAEDPVVASARRESLVVLWIFLAAIVYTIGYCALFGYNLSADELTTIGGFPAWIFWGVLFPWALCAVAASWFSLAYMRDDDLGAEAEVNDDSGEASGDAPEGARGEHNSPPGIP